MSLSPNWVKSCISYIESDRKIKSLFNGTLKCEEFVSEITFSKYGRYDCHGDVVNPKMGEKGPN